MLIPWLERAPRDDVHPDAQEFLKVLKQADVIKKRRTWLEVHEQIQIAVRASLSPGDGAEHGDPMSPALPGDAEDLRTAAAESLQCQDVIRHVSSVSPRASTTLGSGYEPRVRANQAAQQEQGRLPGAEILLVEVGADLGLVVTRDFQSPARTIRETYLGLLSCRSSMSSRPSVSIMASTPYSAARSASEPDKTVSLPCVRARRPGNAVRKVPPRRPRTRIS